MRNFFAENMLIPFAMSPGRGTVCPSAWNVNHEYERDNRQVQWFAEQLVEALGGDDAFNRVCDELGL